MELSFFCNNLGLKVEEEEGMVIVAGWKGGSAAAKHPSLMVSHFSRRLDTVATFHRARAGRLRAVPNYEFFSVVRKGFIGVALLSELLRYCCHIYVGFNARSSFLLVRSIEIPHEKPTKM